MLKFLLFFLVMWNFLHTFVVIKNITIMETILSKIVIEVETVSPHVFNNLINNTECDTEDDLECVGFSGVFIDGQDRLYIDFFGNRENNYTVKVEEFYITENFTASSPPRIMGVTKDQRGRLQAIIDAKVIELEADRKEAMLDMLRRNTDPALFIGSKQWVSETGVNNKSFI